MEENLQRILNTNRAKQFRENTDALEESLSSEGTDSLETRKPTFRVKGSIPTVNHPISEEDDKLEDLFEGIDDETAETIRETVAEVQEEKKVPDTEPEEEEETEELEELIPNPANNPSVGEQLLDKIRSILHKKDEEEYFAPAPIRVTDTEELPANNKKSRKGCAIIAGLAIGALVMLIGGKKVIKWLKENIKNDDLDTTPIATMAPDSEPTPSDALVTPEDIATAEAAQVFNPESKAAEEYNYLHSLESNTEQINLPYDEDSILNIIYTLNPSLNKASNLDIGEASSICNNIAANTITHNKKSNIYNLLNCDEETTSLLESLEDAAIKVKLENFNGEAETLGIYTAEQKAYAESNGVDISDDKHFFEVLNQVMAKIDVNDPKNVGIMVIVDAIHNGATPNLTNYINHYEDGAEAETNFRMLEQTIFSDEMLTKFAEVNTEEVIPEVAPEVAEAKGDSYYRYLQNIEQERGVTFNVDEDSIASLTSYLNGEGTFDPKEAKAIFTEIAKICKSVGVSPAFHTLVKNEKYSKLISDIEGLLNTLKVDYDYEDDKALYNYLIINLIDQHTAIINYVEDDQIAIFMAIMGMYDNYRQETYNYTWNGKNGELVGNDNPYLSCAQGVENALYDEYDAIVDYYQKKSLQR